MGATLPEDRVDEPVTVESLVSNLRALGVEAGQTLLVHGSLSSLGYVCGGASAVVDALQRAVTSEGTLVLPTHSPGNMEPSEMSSPPVPESWYETVREQMPPYRPEVTPTQGMGAIAECFRSYPGVSRSSHPQHSFAAWGADSSVVTEDPSLSYSLGEDSPLGRVYDLDSDLLYLGTTHETSTSIHLAEYRAAIDIGTRSCASAMLVDGTRKWVEWKDIDFTDEDFPDCGAAFGRECPEAFETGQVGAGEIKRIDQPALVDFAVEWLEANR